MNYLRGLETGLKDKLTKLLETQYFRVFRLRKQPLNLPFSLPPPPDLVSGGIFLSIYFSGPTKLPYLLGLLANCPAFVSLVAKLAFLFYIIRQTIGQTGPP